MLIRILSVLYALCYCNISNCQESFQISNLSKAVNLRANGIAIGSGLYYNVDSITYLVTAAHVLYQNEGKSEDLKYSEIELISYDSVINNITKFKIEISTKVVHKHTLKDICVIRIGKIHMNFEGIKLMRREPYVKILKWGILNSFNLDQTIPFEKLEAGNELIVIGYPTDIAIPDTSIYDFTFPLLQNGVISGLNKTNQFIIISSSIYGGNSGGAVMASSNEIEALADRIIVPYGLIGIVVSRFQQKVNLKIPTIKSINSLPEIIDYYIYTPVNYAGVVPIKFADEVIKNIKNN